MLSERLHDALDGLFDLRERMAAVGLMVLNLSEDVSCQQDKEMISGCFTILQEEILRIREGLNTMTTTIDQCAIEAGKANQRQNSEVRHV